MDLWVVSTVAGTIAGGLGILILGVLLSLFIHPMCPDCSERLSFFRKPATLRQAFWGGYTCPKCGCEMDGRGKKIKNS